MSPAWTRRAAGRWPGRSWRPRWCCRAIGWKPGCHGKLRGLNDSKQLTEAQRENFFALITSQPEIRYAIALVDAEMIDRINILQAAWRAMNQALEQLIAAAAARAGGRPACEVAALSADARS